jgi:DNA-binding CsgD family transcriptional regulator
MLDRLCELSLVRPSSRHESGFHPVAPDIATDLLIARQQARLTADLAKIEQCRAAAAQFVATCSVPERDRGLTDSVQLVGAEAIRERLLYLSHNARTEIMRFGSERPTAEADAGAWRQSTEELLRRGVRIRAVYQDSVRDHPQTWAYANWLRDIGGEVRVTATLPTRVVIFDRRQAVVVSTDPAEAHARAVLVWGRPMVTALTALFEPIWSHAVPIGLSADSGDDSLSEQESTVLRLLAAGLTDEAVAKRIGCSPRTARRIASQLMERLGAQSRFQAGVHAAANGWLSGDR